MQYIIESYNPFNINQEFTINENSTSKINRKDGLGKLKVHSFIYIRLNIPL